MTQISPKFKIHPTSKFELLSYYGTEFLHAKIMKLIKPKTMYFAQFSKDSSQTAKKILSL
jgi:hypothetical protein